MELHTACRRGKENSNLKSTRSQFCIVSTRSLHLICLLNNVEKCFRAMARAYGARNLQLKLINANRI